MADQLSPSALVRRLGRAGVDAGQLGTELPDGLRRLLDMLDQGGPEIRLRADDLEPLMARAERLGNRLIVGIIAAAFIDGLAELMTADAESWRSRQRPVLAFGLGAAGTLGGYLAWTARRTHRPRTVCG